MFPENAPVPAPRDERVPGNIFNFPLSMLIEGELPPIIESVPAIKLEPESVNPAMVPVPVAVIEVAVTFPLNEP